MSQTVITILGGGPAGASAALAALAEGARVELIEKSRLPRHKVCGEFFSPEIERELEVLGVWDGFLAAGPARIRRMALYFGTRSKTALLPEGAWGLSRYVFDAMLAGEASARVPTRHAEACATSAAPVHIIGAGRPASKAVPGRRLFGFKAHFEGASNDAVELYFFQGVYVGVAPIEGGRTNVCGLGPESFLKRFHFEYDEVLRQSPPLAERVAPLRRVIDWVSTGPLEYGQHFVSARDHLYPAGDALSFVDPFTGSGLLAAVRTGALAGRAAARLTPPEEYLRQCRASLRKPFAASKAMRSLVASGWAEKLIGLAPSRVLYALTRPR
jgi:flavin-dependent dehydrogenase